MNWKVIIITHGNFGKELIKSTEMLIGEQSALCSLTKMKQIMDSLGVLGLFMMGVLSSQYVKVSSSLKFSVQGKEFVIQQILDKILPGLLPLLTVMGLYFFFEKKGLKITKGMFLLTAVLIILALLQIL